MNELLMVAIAFVCVLAIGAVAVVSTVLITPRLPGAKVASRGLDYGYIDELERDLQVGNYDPARIEVFGHPDMRAEDGET